MFGDSRDACGTNLDGQVNVTSRGSVGGRSLDSEIYDPPLATRHFPCFPVLLDRDRASDAARHRCHQTVHQETKEERGNREDWEVCRYLNTVPCFLYARTVSRRLVASL